MSPALIEHQINQRLDITNIDDSAHITNIHGNPPHFFEFLSQQVKLDSSRLDITLTSEHKNRFSVCEKKFSLPVTVHNNTDQYISSLKPYPIFLSYHWLDNDRNMQVFEGTRTIVTPVLPGAMSDNYSQISTPDKSGQYILPVSYTHLTLPTNREV